MAEKDNSQQPSHRAYGVIRREHQDDFWLNVGVVFPHKDGGGFTVMLQALPFDGKIVCRKVDETTGPTMGSSHSKKRPRLVSTNDEKL